MQAEQLLARMQRKAKVTGGKFCFVWVQGNTTKLFVSYSTGELQYTIAQQYGEIGEVLTEQQALALLEDK